LSTEWITDTPEARKARGAFFTPAPICEFIAEWAIRDAADTVMEPSCGDGAILGAAARRSQSLGGSVPVVGYELHADSARLTEVNLAKAGYPASIRAGDFLAVPPSAAFTAVVGNPPYIRYQGFTGEARANGLAAALTQGVRLSKLASSWAPFVIHASGFITAGGRLGLVLPAELLSSNYAQEVRDFLLRRFARVSVVLFGRQVFPEAQTEALLLLAEGSGGTDRVHFAEIDDAASLSAVSFDEGIPTVQGQRWTAALVSHHAQESLGQLVQGGGLQGLESWGRLSLGMVTGNNRYFTLSPHEAKGIGLAPADVLPISPAGSGHLRALELSPAEHRSLGSAGLKTLLFRPDEPSLAARRYIAQGEALGVHQAYKCRVREPWWCVPLNEVPDLFFTYMNAATPQLAVNSAAVRNLNSVHGVYLAEGLRGFALELALASLNSATALSAEIHGRAYGGGILKMEPREAARLLVPSPTIVSAAAPSLRELADEARELLLDGRLDDVRQRVDALLLRHGLRLTSEELAEIRSGHAALSGRRKARGASRSQR